jgi:Domain of unknown function (DUF4166)
MRNADGGSAPLYVRVLEGSWTRIAEPVRLAHQTHSVTRGHGRLRVEHGRHLAARVLARVLRLPPPSASADTCLSVFARGGVEYWCRSIEGWRFDSRQYQSNASELAERFGVLELRFRLEENGGDLLFVQHRAAFVLGPLRLPIPAWCAPSVKARERPSGPAAIGASVRISLPVIGLLIAYDGTIEIEETA